MEIFETIAKRSSYRGPYQDTQVPREDLQKIMEAGLAAPSGCNAQTTWLIGLDDPQLVEAILKLVKKNGFEGASAPAGICVLTQAIAAYANTCYNVQDYAAAIENMLLAITALGYASCWVEGQVTESIETQKEIAKLLNIPDKYTVTAFLPVGVPEKQKKPARKKTFEQRARFNKEKTWT
jgi:nitroreductase